MYLQIRTLASGSHNQLPMQHLLFKKIVKRIDKKDYGLRKANIKIKELKEKLKQLKPRKKKSKLIQILNL